MSVPVAGDWGKGSAAATAAVSGAVDPTVVDPTVRRVLVYRLGSLGDTLVALPSLHLVARAFPNAERRMLTNVPVALRAPAAAAVLGDSGLVHGYELYRVGTRNPLVLLRTLLRLRAFRPEVAVYLKATGSFAVAQRDARFLRLAGVRRTIGLPATPADCEQRTLPDGTFEPEAWRLARTLRTLGDGEVNSPAAWDLRLNRSEVERADAVTQPLGAAPYFAVSVGTKVQSKDWGTENWKRLLRSVAEAFPGHGLLLAGAPEEAHATDAAAAGWQSVDGAGPVLNVCGQLSPRETAAAFRNARAFVGHDSGPMHLAAVVGTPVVAIFAARNRPRTWFPVGVRHRVLYHWVDCWGCGLETCTIQRKKCLLSITVQEVMAALHALLQEPDLPQKTDVRTLQPTMECLHVA